MNQFGSERRMKLALEVDSLDDVAGRIEGLLQLKSPEGLLGKLKMLPMLAEVGRFFPRTVSGKRRALQAGHPAGKLQRPGLSRTPVLAARWRPLYYPPLRDYPGPQERKAQPGHVPHAGL